METRPAYVLRLYVADQAVETEKLSHQLKELLNDHLGEGAVEHVDVLVEPERAMEEDVFATPMAVKELPPPVQKLIGDLRNPEKVLLLFGVVGSNGAGK